jgi:hypothetical protein
MCSRSSRLPARGGPLPPPRRLAYYELLFWGGGHVLQAGNVALDARALAAPAAPLDRPGGAEPRHRHRVDDAADRCRRSSCRWLAFAGTTGTAYFSMATHLMRWTIFPVVLVVLGTGVLQVWRSRPAGLGRLPFRGPRGQRGADAAGLHSGFADPWFQHAGARALSLRDRRRDDRADGGGLRFLHGGGPPVRHDGRARAARVCNSCSSAAAKPSSASGLPWPAPTAWAASNTASSNTCAPLANISA